jgi:photosystem II stability/assembly factor-like uncharacterized protein
LWSLAFVTAIDRGQAGEATPAHDFYILGQMSRAVFMGSKPTALNGIYRSSDRVEVTHLGPNHPVVNAITADPRNPRILFAAALNGVLRSTNGGEKWTILTSWDMTEPKSIAIDPHAPDHIYIGLPDGIGVSLDAGHSWKRMNDGIKRRYTQSIIVDRTKAGRLVAGTEKGIYVSEDGAKSWHLARASDKTVHNVEQSPHDPKIFFAATEANGLWRSRDGARTWEPIPGVGSDQTLHNVEFDPANPRRLVACGWGPGVIVSEDGGDTWAAANAGLPNTHVWRVAIDPDLPNRLYAAPHEKPLHVSDDFGRTWRPLWFDSTKIWGFFFLPRP